MGAMRHHPSQPAAPTSRSRRAPRGFVDRPAGVGFPAERRTRSPVDSRMDNPAGCRPPAAHKLHRAPQAQIKSSKTNIKKPCVVLRHQALDHYQLRSTPTPSKHTHTYLQSSRAIQHRLQTGHVPEIIGHIRRNTQQLDSVPAQFFVQR